MHLHPFSGCSEGPTAEAVAPPDVHSELALDTERGVNQPRSSLAQPPETNKPVIIILMSKIAIIALANAATSLATAAAALAEQYGEGAVATTAAPTTQTEQPPVTEAPKPSGKGTRGKAPAAPEAPKEPTPAGETPEERVARLKLACESLVKAGRGGEVKAVIQKYGSCLSEIPANKETEFLRDIEALEL